MAKPKPFATEIDLCAAFLAAAPTDKWTAYAETAGWDILLVRKVDGFQVGIQAKLRLNVEVMTQALESGSHWCNEVGPDCRAVLVPFACAGGWGEIAAAVGITIIRVFTQADRIHGRHFRNFDPDLPDKLDDTDDCYRQQWFERAPKARCRLPEYVPDVAAGASAPLQLTTWKIRAIKLAITLERRGYVTRADFKHLGLDHRRFVDAYQWLAVDGQRFVKGKHQMPFKAAHPRNYAEIEADAGKWMRVVPQQLELAGGQD